MDKQLRLAIDMVRNGVWDFEVGFDPADPENIPLDIQFFCCGRMFRVTNVTLERTNNGQMKICEYDGVWPVFDI